MFQKIKTLFLNLVVYGTGDVLTHIVSFLLLPFFTNVLSQQDYGIWGVLLTANLVARIAFRWGVDASFMRFFYDCENDRERQRLASTIFFFMLATNGALLAVAVGAAPLYSEAIFRVPGQTLALQLTLISTFVSGFFFLPFHVFRIRRQAKMFSAISSARAAAVLISRIVLVTGFHYGVMGFVLSDFVVTMIFAVVLMRWFAPLLRPMFSRTTLREVLHFGLPRVPHGIAQQVVGPTTDPALMQMLAPGTPVAVLNTIGLYQVGSSIGLALKFFLAAFEFAWAPFYFQTMKEKDAPRTFAVITTYGMAALVLLAAGLSAVAADLVRLMTQPKFYEAARVVPWTALAVTLQGAYLLTSIGLNITKQTRYYPVATAIAAAANIAANVLLIPRFGILGPAISNVISYAVLVVVAYRLSQRFYPITYEWGRILRIVAAGIGAYAAAVLLVPDLPMPYAGVAVRGLFVQVVFLDLLLLRGTVVVVAFLGLLGVTGFFHRKELDHLRSLAEHARLVRRAKAEGAAVDMPTEPIDEEGGAASYE